jgi:ornithine cyclodeaminase
MAIIGLGAQSEFQASAFQSILGIDRLRVFDIDGAAAAKFERNMAGSGLSVTRCACVRDAALGADIVTTITADKKAAEILTEAMVGAGAHVNGVGGDCPGKTELSPGLLRRSRVFVEYEPQTRIEGDIQQLPHDHPVTELWEVIAGKTPGRACDAEITVFDSVGFAIEDFSILRLLRDLASETGVGEDLDLLAAPPDPRDLFSLLCPPLASEDRRCA